MKTLEKSLGYQFHNPALLEEALRHSSYANEHRGDNVFSNERLEFLGDSVLGFVTAEYLFAKHPTATEAVFAAVYLDGGIRAASELIHRVLLDKEREETAEAKRRVYKTKLQELVQRTPNQVLTYRLIGEQGPDHDKVFSFAVLLNDTVVGTGEGRSKKEAEQMAAKDALESMNR